MKTKLEVRKRTCWLSSPWHPVALLCLWGGLCCFPSTLICAFLQSSSGLFCRGEVVAGYGSRIALEAHQLLVSRFVVVLLLQPTPFLDDVHTRAHEVVSSTGAVGAEDQRRGGLPAQSDFGHHFLASASVGAVFDGSDAAAADRRPVNQHRRANRTCCCEFFRTGPLFPFLSFLLSSFFNPTTTTSPLCTNSKYTVRCCGSVVCVWVWGFWSVLLSLQAYVADVGAEKVEKVNPAIGRVLSRNETHLHGVSGRAEQTAIWCKN